MIRWIIHRKLGSVERQFGVPLDYLRHMVDTSLPAFMKFAKLMPVAAYKKRMPADALHVACLVASRHADCGTCLQMGVNMAKQQGLDGMHIQAVLERRVDDLPEALSDAYRFAETTVTANGQESTWRDKIRNRHGEEALIELSMAIALAGVFPTVKRGLGYAISCSQVDVQV